MTSNVRAWIRTTVGMAVVVPIAVTLFGMQGCPFAPVTPPPTTGDSGVTGDFAGPLRCSQCHMNIYTDWAQTLHARALDDLEAVGQGTNPDCLVCHTTGYGQAGGFVDRATTNVLAHVTCEACHDARSSHANNASDASLRPIISLSADVCGRCHTGAHQPNYDDWLTSKHAASLEPTHVTSFMAGTAGRLSNCGNCHSGDWFYHKIIKEEDFDRNGKPVDDNYLKDVPDEQMIRITCAICHNPHARTNNAAMPDAGRDYQLRFAQIKFPTLTTDLTTAQDRTRFNICGQCHHVRNNVWTDTSRDPHPSDQSNVFFGEIPLPDSDPTPIVANRASVHLNTPLQCSTCHVARTTAQGGIAPQVSGHTFEVNFLGCVQCHNSVEIAMAKHDNLHEEIEYRAQLVKDALDAWTARALTGGIPGGGAGLFWEYTNSGGGPPATGNDSQQKIPDEIKKARYLYYYVEGGGGGGVHNPDFVREALMTALDFASNAPDRLPN